MKIKYNQVEPEKLPKDLFVVTIYTMQGDADDEHQFDIQIKNQEELRKCIIACEILSNVYPNGKGGYEGYDHCLHWDKFFDKHWYRYEDEIDSYEGYSVSYFSGDRLEFDCEITLDKEMIDFINNWKEQNIKT